MSSRFWTAFCWNDYAGKTGHLSLCEHGAYLLLMSHYYTTRRPLPANAEQLHRVCRCTTDADRAAVDSVLQQFFYLDGLGESVYRHTRIDEELAKALDISGKRRDAAKKKHAKESSANAPAIAHANAEQVHTQSQSQLQLQSKTKTQPRKSKCLAPDSGESSADPRHVLVREFIKFQYQKKFKHECPWDGSEAKALKLLLASIPTWNFDQLKGAVVNHFSSQDVAADRPRVWLSNLSRYAVGPVDRFNKKSNGANDGHTKGNGINRAQQRQADSLAARDAARAAIMGRG